MKVSEELKHIMYGKIDWIKVFKDAYEQRKTSWRDLGHIQEWRNATDEVLFAVWHQLEDYLKESDKHFIAKEDVLKAIDGYIEEVIPFKDEMQDDKNLTYKAMVIREEISLLKNLKRELGLDKDDR